VETQELFLVGHGTAPDLIYAKRVPDSPSLNPTSFSKKHCTIFIVEIDMCRNLGCDITLAEKTEKYSPLIAALEKYWGRVEFVAFPIGHAYTTLKTTLDHFIDAFPAPKWSKQEPTGASSTPPRITMGGSTTITYSILYWTLSQNYHKPAT